MFACDDIDLFISLTLSSVINPIMNDDAWCFCLFFSSFFCSSSSDTGTQFIASVCISINLLYLWKVPNQLVGAPLVTDVTLICNVEASPKAINYWQRENGKIMSRKIFNISFFIKWCFFLRSNFHFHFNFISIYSTIHDTSESFSIKCRQVELFFYETNLFEFLFIDSHICCFFLLLLVTPIRRNDNFKWSLSDDRNRELNVCLHDDFSRPKNPEIRYGRL